MVEERWVNTSDDGLFKGKAFKKKLFKETAWQRNSLQTTANCFWSPSQENPALRFARLFCISLLEREKSPRSENEWAQKQSREQQVALHNPCAKGNVNSCLTWEKAPRTWTEWKHHWYQRYICIQTDYLFPLNEVAACQAKPTTFQWGCNIWRLPGKDWELSHTCWHWLWGCEGSNGLCREILQE